MHENGTWTAPPLFCSSEVGRESSLWPTLSRPKQNPPTHQASDRTLPWDERGLQDVSDFFYNESQGELQGCLIYTLHLLSHLAWSPTKIIYTILRTSSATIIPLFQKAAARTRLAFLPERTHTGTLPALAYRFAARS